jgi:hypothetical protein
MTSVTAKEAQIHVRLIYRFSCTNEGTRGRVLNGDLKSVHAIYRYVHRFRTVAFNAAVVATSFSALRSGARRPCNVYCNVYKKAIMPARA